MATLPPQVPHNAKPEPSSNEPLTPKVSPRWILFGSLAMILGLIMGFIMSSLGK